MAIYLINKFYAGATPDDVLEVEGALDTVRAFSVTENSGYALISSRSVNDTSNYTGGNTVYGPYQFSLGPNGYVYAIGKLDNAGTQYCYMGYKHPSDSGAWTTEALTWNLDDGISASGRSPLERTPLVFFKLRKASRLSSWLDRLYFVIQDSGNVVVAAYPVGYSGGIIWKDEPGNVMTLDGSPTSPQMRVIFDRLYITNGNYIASVDDEGVFTQHRFQLPYGYTAKDIVGVGDKAVILATRDNTQENVGIWWDMESTSGFIDMFHIPSANVHWVANYADQIYLWGSGCYRSKMYRLSYAGPGAQVYPLQGVGVRTDLEQSLLCDPFTSYPQSVQTWGGSLFFLLSYAGDMSGLMEFARTEPTKPYTLQNVVPRQLYPASGNSSLHGAIVTADALFMSETDVAAGSWRLSRISVSDDLGSEHSSLVTKPIGYDLPFRNKKIQEVFVYYDAAQGATLYGYDFLLNTYISTDFGPWVPVTKADGTNVAPLQGDHIRLIPRGNVVCRTFRIKVEPRGDTLAYPPRVRIRAIAVRWEEERAFSR